MRRPFGLVHVLASSLALPLSAQSRVAGTWLTEFDAQVQIIKRSVPTVNGHPGLEVHVNRE